MDRRSVLRAGCGLTATALSGCLEGVFKTRSVYAPPPVVENRPDAVYIPTHREGMKMIGTTTKNGYTVALFFSFPHRFWNVTGQQRTKVTITKDDSIHLMASLWDAKTKTVLPNTDLRVELEKDGKQVSRKSFWPMLSQNMGYHFGDNITLDGDGTYTAKLRVGPPNTRRSGLRTQSGPVSFTMEFEYKKRQRDEIMFKRLSERQGEPGAIEPMEMKIPSSQLPKKSKLPGTAVGSATSGDGRFLLTRLETPLTGIESTGTYLVVSPRTPHHRYPLPFMSLSGTLKRGGNTVFEELLTPTIDPELGYHYGAVVDAQSGDSLTLTVNAPPQPSRHEGYETAFIDMPPMELSV